MKSCLFSSLLLHLIIVRERGEIRRLISSRALANRHQFPAGKELLRVINASYSSGCYFSKILRQRVRHQFFLPSFFPVDFLRTNYWCLDVFIEKYLISRYSAKGFAGERYFCRFEMSPYTPINNPFIR